MASGSRFTRAVAPVKSLAGALAYLTWQSRHIRHRMPSSASMSPPAAASKNLRASSSLSARRAGFIRGPRHGTLPRQLVYRGTQPSSFLAFWFEDPREVVIWATTSFPASSAAANSRADVRSS